MDMILNRERGFLNMKTENFLEKIIESNGPNIYQNRP